MKISELPHFNKPSQKLMKKGAKSLDEAELLAIIFGRGNKKESALELANRLLKKYNLNKLENLGYKELKKECNQDYVKVLKIISLIELSKRYNKLVNKGYKKKISSSEDVYKMFSHRFINEKQEHFIVLHLDNKNRIIKEETVSVGILNASLVHPREIFKTAIKESANAVILVHNHPSGDCEPSEEDKRITKLLVKAGETLDIEVIDHVIIGNGSWERCI